MLKNNEYRCEKCGEVFETGWSDEEAMAESQEMFGECDDLAVVCDDCWNTIMNQ